MHLKESAYNFIYDDLGKDQIVFYNSRTGALAVVHEDQYKQYKGFQEKGKEIEDAEFLKNLLKCGYLLPAEVDEKFLMQPFQKFCPRLLRVQAEYYRHKAHEQWHCADAPGA